MALREQRPLGNISMPLATREVAVLKIGWDSWTVNMCARCDSCKTANTYDVVGTMSALPHRYLPTARLLSVHPTSAIHLHGRANPHPSCENHPG